jgi:fructokinase
MSPRKTSHGETAAFEQLRIGIDLGGSKIEGILMGPGAAELARHRVPTPRDDYAASIAAIVDLKARLMQGIQISTKIGIAVPGSISPVTGVMQNANSTLLNGRAFDRDLAAALATPVRLANDANCFALSEATDGAAKNTPIVFGVILGTGCGGGLVVNGNLLDGPRGIGGEWGHNPLPWAEPEEYPGPECWCGRRGCLETWVSGPGMAADHERLTGERQTAKEIAEWFRSVVAPARQLIGWAPHERTRHTARFPWCRRCCHELETNTWLPSALKIAPSGLSNSLST